MKKIALLSLVTLFAWITEVTAQELNGKWVLSKVSPAYDVYQIDLKARGGKCYVGEAAMNQGKSAITQACVVDDEVVVVELTDQKSKYKLFYLMLDTANKDVMVLCDENVMPILVEGEKVVYIKQ
jgi:hypothetical protein